MQRPASERTGAKRSKDGGAWEIARINGKHPFDGLQDDDRQNTYVSHVAALSPTLTLSRWQAEFVADYVINELMSYAPNTRAAIRTVAQAFMRNGKSENEAIVSAYTLAVVHGGSIH